MAGFAHLMLKEIWEQPDVVQTCLDTYLPAPTLPPTHPRSLSLPLPPLLATNLEQIHILACGTSRHAGLIAQYWFEQITGIPTRVRSASEFVAAPLPLTPATLTIAITQSGETADTIAAVKHQKSAYTSLEVPTKLLGMTNQPDSLLTSLVDYTLLTLAGDELGVAATKTFTTQLTVLFCLLLDIAYQHQAITDDWFNQMATELRSLPQQLETILLEQEESIKQLAPGFATARNCLVLGQGVNRAIALEGALKLKETTYIHAEGYAAGEFLHGPIALLDETIPVIVIAPNDNTQQQVVHTLRRVKSHNVRAIGITTTDTSPEVLQLFDHAIMLPPTHPLLSPWLTVIPLQLLAYHIAVQKGLNVDRPRHITKTIV